MADAARFKPRKLDYFGNALLICTVDFPIYCIQAISERHIVIAGGGGSSKTGVHNQINILELVPDGDSCAAELVNKYPIPDEFPDAIMTAALMKDLPIVETRLVAGGERLAIYQIDFDQAKRVFNISNYETLNDDLIQSELKCVRYAAGSIFAGSMNGQLTVWKRNELSQMQLHKQMKIHTKEIDEIDVDTVNGNILTLSRGEARVTIYNLRTFRLVKEFKKEFINKSNGNTSQAPGNSMNNVSYNYRSCRYAISSNSNTKAKTSESVLLVACNPTPAKASSKIYKWSATDFKQLACEDVTSDGIMSITVSSDGQHVAIGTRSGSVSIMEVRNLRKIYNINAAHHNAVTNLEFLPSSVESLNLTNSSYCPLLSVSIDRRVILHRPRKSSPILSLLKILIMVIVIYLMFFVLRKYYLSET